MNKNVWNEAMEMKKYKITLMRLVEGKQALVEKTIETNQPLQMLRSSYEDRRGEDLISIEEVTDKSNLEQ